MLVIISDLHISDESTSTNPHPTAFSKVLKEELKGRINQSGKNLVEFHLVLLGDIFDFVRTDYWYSKTTNYIERPWNGDLSRYTAMNETGIVKQHFINILNRIFDSDSAKALRNTIQEINELMPLKITYVIGNHDRAINNFPVLEKMIKSFFGIDNITFSNWVIDPNYGVIARHGHEYDSINHGFELFKEELNIDDNGIKKFDGIGRFSGKDAKFNVYTVQTFGEVITAELMSGTVFQVDKLNQKVLTDKVKEVNNVRPLSLGLEYLSLLGETDEVKNSPDPATKDKLIKILKGQISALVNSKLAQKHKYHLFKFAQDLPFSSFEGLRDWLNIANFFSDLCGSNGEFEDDLYKGAIQDAKNNPGINYFIYGHTHIERQDTFNSDSKNNVQMYVNTGTYLPLIQRAQDEKGFYELNQMTMTFLYKAVEDSEGNADGKPTIDIWIGKKHKNYLLK
ncbi:MAG: hypothetical protein JST55_16500 [Bacteroidetes bacterium]|nr:hypothetical protein [Bacteroidota bacterium]